MSGQATAGGPGSAEALERVPALLGADDDCAGFEPRHPVVRASWARHPGWRVPRTGQVLQRLNDYPVLTIGDAPGAPTLIARGH